MTVCSKCGSSDVQELLWVGINTGELGSPVSDGEMDDKWCNKCEDHPPGLKNI